MPTASSINSPSPVTPPVGIQQPPIRTLDHARPRFSLRRCDLAEADYAWVANRRLLLIHRRLTGLRYLGAIGRGLARAVTGR